MYLFTIGFTQKRAERFFTLLKDNQVKRLADIRLNNVSQLAGFSKFPDIQYFLKAIAGIEYVHLPYLAPDDNLLSRHRKKEIDWAGYEREFLALMEQRNSFERMKADIVDGTCLLCSEPKPSQCHRGIVAREIAARMEGVMVRHL